MSVVISYYNDEFAIILTDRMVTSSLGHWEETKLYDIPRFSYGACAGVGLANGIYAVRDLLSTSIGFNDIEAINQFIKSRNDYPGFEFVSYTAFSVGTVSINRVGYVYRPAIFTFHVCGDGKEVFINRIRNEKNQFNILYPQTYLDNKSIYDKFVKENSLLGDDNMSAEKAFRRAKALFETIQQDSTEIVSQSGDVSIFRYDKYARKYTTKFCKF